MSEQRIAIIGKLKPPSLARAEEIVETSPERTSANRVGSAAVSPLGATHPSTRNRERRHLRFHQQYLHLSAPFGSDWFGRKAETFARLFGTPAFLIAQTSVVIAWIAVNVVWAVYRWDPYPFILLNLAFSLQAAYA